MMKYVFLFSDSLSIHYRFNYYRSFTVQDHWYSPKLTTANGPSWHYSSTCISHHIVKPQFDHPYVYANSLVFGRYFLPSEYSYTRSPSYSDESTTSTYISRPAMPSQLTQKLQIPATRNMASRVKHDDDLPEDF